MTLARPAAKPGRARCELREHLRASRTQGSPKPPRRLFADDDAALAWPIEFLA